MFSGKTSWGKPIPPSWRFNSIAGTMIIFGILEGLRKAMGLDYEKFLFLWGPAPAYLSPPMQIILGTYKYIVAQNDWQRDKAIRQIKYSYKAFIPGSMAWRDLSQYLKGEKTLKEYLFYTQKEPPKGKVIVKKKLKPMKKVRVMRRIK